MRRVHALFKCWRLHCSIPHKLSHVSLQNVQQKLCQLHYQPEPLCSNSPDKTQGSVISEQATYTCSSEDAVTHAHTHTRMYCDICSYIHKSEIRWSFAYSWIHSWWKINICYQLQFQHLEYSEIWKLIQFRIETDEKHSNHSPPIQSLHNLKN